MINGHHLVGQLPALLASSIQAIVGTMVDISTPVRHAVVMKVRLAYVFGGCVCSMGQC